MLQPVLKVAHHIRVRPLSVNDRQAIKVPIVRIRPQPQLLTRPKPVALKPIRQATRPHQPTPAETQPQSQTNIARFKGIGKDKILVIIANGPSHKLARLDMLVNLQAAGTIHTMTINKPDDRLWPTTYWLFCDNTQLIRHRSIWDLYKGPIFNSPSITGNKTNTVKVISIHKLGFGIDLEAGMHIGYSSTYAAMQVANYMDYSKIYLIGCDMNRVDGRLYPWGTNPDVSDNVREKRFANEAKYYQWAADNLSQEIRNKFIFCSQYNTWPFLQKFRNISYQEAIAEILNLSQPVVQI